MIQMPGRLLFSRIIAMVHDVGLDAALVAVVWQVMISRNIGATSPPQSTVALFFAVWGIYLGDRLWDVRSNNNLNTRRHRVARRHGLLLGLLAGFSFLMACLFASAVATLSACLAGGVVAGLCTVYYLARAAFPGWECGRAGVVGGVFAAGTLLPVAVVGSFTPSLGWSLLALGALFTANVRLCSWAEARLAGLITPLSLLFPLLFSGLGFAFLAWEGFLYVSLAGTVSITALLLLSHNCETIEPEALASRADAALLIPVSLVLAAWLLLSCQVGLAPAPGEKICLPCVW